MTDESGRRPGGARQRDEEHGGSTSAGTFAGLGLQLAIAILLFLYLGQWLDRKLGTSPWLLILGVFVGAGAGFYNLYRKLMAEQARDDAKRK